MPTMPEITHRKWQLGWRDRPGAGILKPRSMSCVLSSAERSTGIPNLQIVIGHLGEALPFMLPRIDTRMTTRDDQAEPSYQHLSA